MSPKGRVKCLGEVAVRHRPCVFAQAHSQEVSFQSLSLPAISFSRGSSWPRDRIQVSRIEGGLSTVWASRESLRTRVNMKQCCRLVDNTCNYNLNTIPPPTVKDLGGAKDSTSQERPWSRYCRNEFQTQPTFKKPTSTGKFSSCPFRKEKNKLRHRTRCSASPLII